jgi:hypothetical protein
VVEARSGDRLLASWSFDGRSVETRAAELPVLAPGQRLSLRLPDAHSGAGEPRLLGPRFVELRASALSRGRAPGEPAKLRPE